MSTELHMLPKVCADSLISITSLGELTDFYSNRGITFNDNSNDKTELFRRLQRDWSKCFVDEIRKSSTVMPENLPFHSLEVDGKRYKIYGIAHHALIGKKYISLVDNIFKEAKDFVLFEQKLGTLFPNAERHLEMPDHFLYPFKNYLINTFEAMSPWELLKIRKMLTEDFNSISFVNLPFKYMASSTITINKESFQIPSLLAINLNYFDLACKRSAYMAELARNFPTDSIEMIVGGGHVVEIDHFLKNGGSPQKIIDAAKHHADIYSRRGPAGFRKHCNLIKLKNDIATEIAYCTIVSSYLAAGTGLLVGVKSLLNYVF